MLVIFFRTHTCVALLPSIIKLSSIPLNSAYPVELKTLGDHIRKKRLDLDLEQKNVASILDVTESTVWNWENNRNNPDVKYYPVITNFLGYCPYDSHGFKRLFKLYRTHNGYSFRSLAKELSVDPTTIKKWEKDNFQPGIEKILSLMEQ